ncbi:MAG: rhomboid family intramembrane serine protease, partial [Bradymonadaceae bacterium]
QLEIVKDPERYLDLVQREISLARIMSRNVTLTWWLLISNVVFWLAALFYGLHLVGDVGLETRWFNPEQLTFYTGMKVNEHIADGQWWRLISSQFVHLDFLHILFNGYGLFILGPILERFYGPRRLFVLYIASGTVGALASFYFNEMPSGGASGAIYGLVGGLLVFGFKYRKSLPKRVSRAFTVGLLPWVGLSLAIGFFDGIPMDNAAHLGGLFSGGIITFFLASRLKARQNKIVDGVLWGLAGLGVAALLVTAVQWSEEITHCTEDRPAYLQCYPEIAERFEESSEAR